MAGHGRVDEKPVDLDDIGAQPPQIQPPVVASPDVVERDLEAARIKSTDQVVSERRA